MAGNLKTYTVEEVAKHNKNTDLWIIINGEVFDVTSFADHPGTIDALLDYAGKDATEAFEDQGHSKSAKKLMKDFLIGKLATSSDKPVVESEISNEKTAGSTLRIITENELRKHSVPGDCWLLIDGKIYDVSNFAHPGGKQILVDNSGRDASREFIDIGHKGAHLRMPSLLIGEIELKGRKDWSPVESAPVEKTPVWQYIVGIVGLLIVFKVIGLI
uniref:Cytochrome b5 heme-binding domain-containing protein n=1 Tax=Euplotes harpa TaxID=151035 RepID=A0A7S3J182_9SPIT|mmetsp:Transcript_14249/g.16471  ORF Transcript_14249/g.16471 Transcript_14249/m.16471 type:complete len:216 (+) Transcript_14249:29-676(+)